MYFALEIPSRIKQIIDTERYKQKKIVYLAMENELHYEAVVYHLLFFLGGGGQDVIPLKHTSKG